MFPNTIINRFWRLLSLFFRRRYEYHRRVGPRHSAIVYDERMSALSVISSHTTLHLIVVVVVRGTRVDVFSFLENE